MYYTVSLSSILDGDFKDAAIVIMSVKPVMLEGADPLSALNQAKIFQHSVPFTESGGVHAKNIDEQWKRITLFEVKQPFPSVVYRLVRIGPLEGSYS